MRVRPGSEVTSTSPPSHNGTALPFVLRRAHAALVGRDAAWMTRCQPRLSFACARVWWARRNGCATSSRSCPVRFPSSSRLTADCASSPEPLSCLSHLLGCRVCPACSVRLFPVRCGRRWFVRSGGSICHRSQAFPTVSRSERSSSTYGSNRDSNRPMPTMARTSIRAASAGTREAVISPRSKLCARWRPCTTSIRLRC